ncbi:MAG TPA: FeoA family protein [Dehalococcoidales bacterium]|nr:FeoA family protein [Dehalococcoidales bacterium]
MSGKKLVTLRQMQSGKSGKVVQVQGGMGLANRLSALGVRPGKKITKVSSMLMRGPVTIQSGNTRMAIGFGMANKIIVEIEES